MAHDAPPSGGEPRETRLARATRAAVLAGLRQSPDGPGPLLRGEKTAGCSVYHQEIMGSVSRRTW